MVKKEALQKFHKDNILDAAGELFQKQGVEGTTMDQIARKAEYSKATIYVYFKSKEEIYYYVMLKGMQELLNRINAGIETGEGVVKQYRAICREMVRFGNEHPFQFQALIETIAVDPESRRELPVLEEIYQVGEQINDEICKVFLAAREEGVLREGLDILQTGFTLWASLTSVIRMANSKVEYIEQRMQMTKAEFLEGSFEILLKTFIKEEAEYEKESN